MKFAIIQPDLVWQDKNQNFLKIQNLVSHQDEVDLIVLPETFSTGFTMRSKEFSENIEGKTENFLITLSQSKKALVGGGWIEKNPNGEPYNTYSFAYNDNIIARYRKIHPFSLGGEDRHYTPGSETLTFNWKNWNISPLICYDLRFPEAFRKTAGETDLYIVGANWPTERIEHWLTLLKARAIENQAFILGSNRVGYAGSSNKLFHNGMSAYFDPMGNGAVLPDKEGVLEGVLHHDELKKIREKLPFLKDRKQI